MHDLLFRLAERSRATEQQNSVQRPSYPLYSAATLRKATRVTFERQDDAMNYKMTAKAKVSSGFAKAVRARAAAGASRPEAACQPTSQPASNRPTSQPPSNLMK